MTQGPHLLTSFLGLDEKCVRDIVLAKQRILWSIDSSRSSVSIFLKKKTIIFD